LTQANTERDGRAPRRVTLRRSRAVRLAACAFALVGAAAVHVTAAAHLAGIEALWLAAAVLAALGIAFARYERRQPAFIELTVEGVAAFDSAGRPLFAGRIVGFTRWAERLLFFAIAGADERCGATLIVCADSVDAAAFRALAVRGRHAAY
jgi:O-antigen/teichoic acid export membrane protein